MTVLSVQAFVDSTSRRRAIRWTVASVACALAVGAPTLAAAQSSNCPPGSWFCDSAPATNAPAAGSNGQLQQLPPADAKPVAPPAAAAAPASASTTPPVVIYQPGPPVVVVQGKAEKPAPYPYTPRDPNARPKREWGLNLHLMGAMIGEGKHDNAGMGGLGLGLRFRPHPVVAIEPTIDFYGGRDYNGFRRGETSFAINTLLFANPRSKVVQLYFPIGFGWSGARVIDDRTGPYEKETSYSYFGFQAGIGLEFRVARHFALNTDIRGFMRGRTDQDAERNPEFTDGYRSTNTSGGGVFTGGMTFYF